MTVKTTRLNSTEQAADLRPWVVSVPGVFANLPVGAFFSTMDPNSLLVEYVKVSGNTYRLVGFLATFEADDPMLGLHTWRYVQEVPRPDDYVEVVDLKRAKRVMLAWEEEGRSRADR